MVQKASTLSKSWPVLSGLDIHYMRCQEKANGFTSECVAASLVRERCSFAGVPIQLANPRQTHPSGYHKSRRKINKLTTLRNRVVGR